MGGGGVKGVNYLHWWIHTVICSKCTFLRLVHIQQSPEVVIGGEGGGIESLGLVPTVGFAAPQFWYFGHF